MIFLLFGCAFYPFKPSGLDKETSPQGVKITAAADVMVAIPLKQLEAYGFTTADQESWLLSFRGKSIPYWLVGEDSQQLVFYSPPTRSSYWKENVFLLQPKLSFQLSPDVELSTFLWNPEPPPKSIWEKQPENLILVYVSLEQNLLYQSLAEGDHWFWHKLINRQEQEIPVKFDSPPLGEVLLRFSIYSVTEAPGNPDHSLQITVNTGYAETTFWDGKGYQTVEIFVPSEVFRQGENRLTLSIPDLEGVLAQVSFLDRIDLYFWHMFPIQDQSSQLRFLAIDRTFLQFLKDLPQGSWIWDINDPLNPQRVKTQELMNSDDLRRYLYASKDSFQAPSDLRSIDAKSALVQPETEIEYLAIGPEELLNPLKPLLDLRREQGLKVETIEVEKIYDQSYGFAEPHAIRAYLTQKAQEHPSLRYVLLVGDATYDPAYNITKGEINRLPTFFIDTIFGGQTSTELPFSVFDQSDLSFLESATSFQPTIAVGRLPATSPQQVRQWVSKVITYEQDKMKPQSEAILAIADPYEDYFSRDATAFTELWTAPMRKELFLPTASEDDLPQKIQGYFQQDFQIIAYFGHGAIDLWGKDEIFTAQEAQRLSGQVSYPIVLSFTCLSGYYIHPEVLSLTEALLWNPRGGAILVIAPTSLTLAEDQNFLWKAFVESYQRHEKERIGDVWRDVIARIHLKNEGVRDVVLTYTLFGDPAMTLP